MYRDHQPLFRYMAGKSDIENDQPIRGDELYLIFSMTKMLTCTAALQLFDQGKYTPEDELATYIPAFRQMKVADGGFSMVDTKNHLALTYFQHSYSRNVEMQINMRNALYACFNESEISLD